MNQIKFNTIKGSLNVITGCGSGLGRATLQNFIKNGSRAILAIDRHFEPDFIDRLGIDDKDKSKIFLRSHDTFDDKAEQSFSEFVEKYGAIDNLINVAGVCLAFVMSEKTLYNMEHANNLINFNTLGTFNMIRHASKYMIQSNIKSEESLKKDRTKCIINTSCISTSFPSVGQTFYAASKASLDSLTLCIARELSPFNIRCNTINVGHFDTKLLRALDEKVLEFAAKEICGCPKRFGYPDEFAHLVKSIVENHMLNGCCIKLDGLSRELLASLKNPY